MYIFQYYIACNENYTNIRQRGYIFPVEKEVSAEKFQYQTCLRKIF